ncbi:MAG: phage head closure protein [Marinilabiliaceae bacterium]|nr:phage head closure protein [Marinilabiliaceae bacterium]
MHIGLLDTPLTIQQPTRTTSSMGQPVTTFADVATVWARIEETGASEATEANRAQSIYSARVTIRHYPDITMRHRLMIDGQPHEITGIQNTGRRQFSILTVIRRDQA